MILSLKNESGHLLEMSRTVRGPMLTTKPCVIWGSVTKFRTPLNILQAGSFILFEVFSNGSTTADWSYEYHIKTETVQSGFVELGSKTSESAPKLVVELTLAFA